MSEQQRDSNRELFPETARVVDEFRRVFGADQVKLVYAIEDGKEIGKRPIESTDRINAGQWLEGCKLIEQDRMRREAANKNRRGG